MSEACGPYHRRGGPGGPGCQVASLQIQTRMSDGTWCGRCCSMRAPPAKSSYSARSPISLAFDGTRRPGVVGGCSRMNCASSAIRRLTPARSRQRGVYKPGGRAALLHVVRRRHDRCRSLPPKAFAGRGSGRAASSKHAEPRCVSG